MPTVYVSSSDATTSTPLGSEQRVTITQQCLNGDLVTGGGYWILNGQEPGPTVWVNGPTNFASGGWAVTLIGPNSFTVRVFADCIDVTP